MSQLPSGTVTFLFTDIAGSTALWERDREAMQSALAQHDALLRTAIESRNGHVFKTVGDAFCAAFARAQDAVEATVEAGDASDAATREAGGLWTCLESAHRAESGVAVTLTTLEAAELARHKPADWRERRFGR